ncbi:hypothetical protein [Streptomyces sp. NPDC046870]|uniref:hypothetical protein n=1 Tax=Streptomyces sp. NPDC046870 TaxID=3155135 RepID=UPI003456D7FA
MPAEPNPPIPAVAVTDNLEPVLERLPGTAVDRAPALPLVPAGPPAEVAAARARRERSGSSYPTVLEFFTEAFAPVTERPRAESG